MTLTIGSLCSGYGGLESSVQSVLGGDLVFVADPDPGAARILTHHHPDVPNLGDITTLAWSTAPRVDILTAGYPCQPFSQAGLRKGTDDERHIWPHICDAICVLRPRLVVLENVRGHLRRGFDTVLADLARVGFDASWVCVRASDVGAPHRRERLFVIAWPKGEIPYFPRTSVAGGTGGAVPGGVTLLPTPDASQGSRGGSQHPDKRRAGGHSVSLADVVEQQLLPTPAARDWKSGQSNLIGTNARPLNEVIENLLPTPRASDGSHGGPNQRGSRGDLMLSSAVQPEHFGPFAAAVSRWESVMGRPAPAPTEPTGKNGRPQLSPRFTEWAMGCPDGHVTAPEIGLSRAEQLHALGNGVVWQQGSYAVRLLLERVTAVAA
ncbi:DNA cytosine methyltransferase [Nocardiopsis changdeensis]|uniref:DNA (cytosine-5-)-methyltransferase n=1 Tax=Nocardiopsis changdeensis TaxID=2831969 RepID=A0ABX8BDL6_9ACTN|nr:MULTISPECIES: DNA cytosine methyltransferase [Nocardiopsis]QUX20340.1 DNA cytosine methyltransferase [Nocardiopsis changdeensis]QYX36270.1 DNA cytosine methyltransferase [Nocardiopsis sp. MT53]